MKKILTLFTMLLVTVSTLLAQAPSLSYQMIVRNQKTDSVGDFAHNDLVYSQSMNVYVAVVEATGIVAKVWAFTGNDTGNGMIAPKATTNMNGMLSLTLNDYQPAELPAGYSLPGTVDATSVHLKWFQDINWQDAKIVVAIPTYGIMDTMEILPVPYAYNVYTDSSITTKRIVDYIDKSHKDAVTSTFSAAHNNEPFMNAMRDSIASVLRNNPDRVKSLAIEFLGKVDTTDVRKANAAINAETKAFVVDTIVDYVINHRPGAYDILGEYLHTATKADVTKLIDAAESNTEYLNEIIEVVADSIIFYMTEHKETFKDVVKDFVDNHTLTPDQIDQIQNVVKTQNPGAYNAAKAILDSLILDYLVDNHYASGICGDNIITVCDLKEQIDVIKENHFAVCPVFGQTTKDGNKLSTPIISNNANLEITSEKCWYEFSFPNSNYPKEVIPATYTYNADGGFISLEIATYLQGREMSVRPKMKVACMDTATFGPAKSIDCIETCECPDIVSFTHTSDAAGELKNNHGVVLKATLTNNYYENAERGFEYSENDGNSWTPLQNSTPVVISANGLTFSDTLKMNFCGKTLLVRPYVMCNDNKYTGDFEVGETVTLRQFELFFDPASPVVSTNGSVDVTVTNGIHITTQQIINEFNGNAWPSVEDIVVKYGDTYGVNPTITYTWVGPNDFTAQGNVATIYAEGEYTATCTITGVFNSNESCVLKKKVNVTQQ